MNSKKMDSSESLTFLLKRFNISQNSNSAGPLDINAFMEVASQHFASITVFDDNQPSTSSSAASTSKASSSKASKASIFDPLQAAVEHLKRQDEKYEQLLQHCNSILNGIKTNIAAAPPPPKELPPPPEIAEMLKLYQRISTSSRATFVSKLTLEDDGKKIFSGIFKSRKEPVASSSEEKKEDECLGGTLAPFVHHWVTKKSKPVDCKVYSTNDSGEMQIFSCHQVVLAHQSVKLRSDIKSMAFPADDKQIMHISLFEYPAKIVESFLVGCYGGHLNNFQGVFLMAKTLRASAVMNSALEEMKSSLTITSVIKQYQFAYDNDLFDLMNACMEFIKKEYKYIKYYDQHKELPKEILQEFEMNVALTPPFLTL